MLNILPLFTVPFARPRPNQGHYSQQTSSSSPLVPSRTASCSASPRPPARNSSLSGLLPLPLEQGSSSRGSKEGGGGKIPTPAGTLKPSSSFSSHTILSLGPQFYFVSLSARLLVPALPWPVDGATFWHLHSLGDGMGAPPLPSRSLRLRVLY